VTTSGDCLETLRVLCHELRRPLTVIRGAAGLLTEDAGRLPEDSRQNMLRLIENSVDTMTEQLDDLLTAQQLEAGEVDIELEPVGLATLLEGAVAAVNRQKPEVRIELRRADELVVEADRDQAERALRAVLANAVRHSPPGGTVEVLAHGDAATARVEILDRGPGIPSGQRELAFQKFARLTRPAGGAGLGLFLARGLARAMGGEVEIGDRPGGGAAVWFTLTRRG
jgi:two-component system sensor histidine kinase KdpD